MIDLEPSCLPCRDQYEGEKSPGSSAFLNSSLMAAYFHDVAGYRLLTAADEARYSPSIRQTKKRALQRIRRWDQVDHLQCYL